MGRKWTTRLGDGVVRLGEDGERTVVIQIKKWQWYWGAVIKREAAELVFREDSRCGGGWTLASVGILQSSGRDG